MEAKINSNYLESYAKEFGVLVCTDYFKTKKYMTGQEIITLTPSIQVNFFVIKILFESWQLEIEKLKSSPFFDYRDKAVHESLREFANLLSRTIKIEKSHFEPLLVQAVKESIQLAINPLYFLKSQFAQQEDRNINQFLKDNKKYIKWHSSLFINLIDRAGLQHTKEEYTKALEKNFKSQRSSLEDFKILLNSMGQVKFLDFDELVTSTDHPVIETRSEPSIDKSYEAPGVSEMKQVEETSRQFLPKTSELRIEHEMDENVLIDEDLDDMPIERKFKSGNAENGLDAIAIWERLENEQYSVMKGTIKDLSESVGLNQRFMFTKELFDGNPDLLKHALRSIDECQTFVEAIQLLNERYVGELGWNRNSEIVEEFVQLVFRKFDTLG